MPCVRLNYREDLQLGIGIPLLVRMMKAGVTVTPVSDSLSYTDVLSYNMWYTYLVILAQLAAGPPPAERSHNAVISRVD